ncbi:acid type B receptor subunit 2 [Seminavis robusta]|uniref:Acid type B receptor subunit 2 n=1 Tax=Seminavis robusta TaxID=568900 RepID=A0A9N8HN13_9STRA|nr:acid type B receptor subunit 2 [Seminavis robusta]|eukprot:Sro1046_g235020.1 acid type B receptor subunit 2 (835) ;mRNA; f:10258-12762
MASFSAKGSVSRSNNGGSSSFLKVVGQQEGSEVLKVYDRFRNETYRNVHLVNFQTITKQERNLLIPQLTYEAAAYVATRHLNERNSSIVPDLTERMQGCDIKFTYEMTETQYNRMVALGSLQKIVTRPDLRVGDWHRYPRPAAIIGGAYSSVSLALANLAGVYQIPQISGSASSAVLDDKNAAPYFSRSFPTNEADAEALMIYFKSIGVTHFGCIHVRDLYGTSFNRAVSISAAKHGIKVYSTAFEASDDQSLKDGLKHLQSRQVRYFFGIIYHDSRETVFREGYNLGIMGHPGFAWILSDSSSNLASKDYSLDYKTESDLAKAVNGVGILLPGIQIHPVLHDILEKDFKTNQELQQDFVVAHPPNLLPILQNHSFANTTMLPSFFTGMVYDAVITLGLAACGQTEHYFSPDQFLKGIRNQSFEGATGHVTYNNVTGTRDLLGLRFAITNVIIAEDSQQLTPGRIQFKSTTPVAIEFPSRVVDLGQGPFVYSDNTTSVPEALPHVDMDMNLIPLGVQGFGWGLMGFIMALSIGCIAFALQYRRKRAVSSAQPAFLVMIASGCLVMATAIIPMSLQEPIPNSGLDIACMSQLYLVCLGFCVSFSALFCKLYRINKLQLRASQFRRVQVHVKDVVYPLVIMVGLNLVVLITWSAVDPLVWERKIEPSRDRFDRPTSSYAICTSNSQTLERLFGGLLFAINFVALALANWECYKGRKLPTEFNETSRIAISMFSLSETLIIGSPILLATQGDPTITFLAKAVLIFCTCLAIMGPIFLPIWNLQTGRESVTRWVTPSNANLSRNGTTNVAASVTAERSRALWINNSDSTGLGYRTSCF